MTELPQPRPESSLPEPTRPEPSIVEPTIAEPTLGEPRLSEPELSALHVNDRELIRRLLTTPARWAVVGLSSNPRRAAVGVSRYIRDELGMTIVPVSLKGDDVHGERGYTLLADIPGGVDVVDCFVNSRNVGAVVDQAIEIGARAVWLQVGVVDEAAAARAKAAGLDVVMDACPMIEAAHLV